MIHQITQTIITAIEKKIRKMSQLREEIFQRKIYTYEEFQQLTKSDVSSPL